MGKAGDQTDRIFFDLNKFVEALDAARKSKLPNGDVVELSWDQVARRAQLSPSTLHNMRRREPKTIDSNTLIRLCAWAGIWNLKPFVGKPPKAPRVSKFL